MAQDSEDTCSWGDANRRRRVLHRRTDWSGQAQEDLACGRDVPGHDQEHPLGTATLRAESIPMQEGITMEESKHVRAD